MQHTLIPHRLSIGDQSTCLRPIAAAPWIIHACKEPCHRAAAGYSGASLDNTNPAYLYVETPGHLYLNLIDPPVPLLKIESFQRALGVARRAGSTPLHIHCNQGRSRAPSLAVVLMAKHYGVLPNTSYEAARGAFEQRFPYAPGLGIASFLSDNWDRIDP